ncbi:MAG: metallophosphoesterase [Firmicutes bacterium]|nr:metallophosphoesterase [Bacillota bacterium]
MKRKFLLMVLSVLLTSAAVCGCSTADGTENTDKKESLTIWTATDLHYLSPRLTDNGELFKKVMLDGDAKLTEYSPQIVDEFLKEVKEAKPDALVITGDITFNGEIASLRDIAEKFKAVKESGIPVLVIPGNHDIDSYRAFSYSGSEVEYTDNISKEEFREICWDLGPADAISVADDSFSYVYALSDDTWIMTVDANTKGAGRVTDETMKWAEAQLKKAQKERITVISATHQSLLAQNKRMTFGYIISNHKDLADLLSDYGVRLNLSGHVHMQHTARDEEGTGFTDIATGSMTVAALRYGILEFDENRDFIYTMASVNMMKDEAKERFDNRTRKQIEEALEGIYIDEDVREQMTAFAVDMNFRYFTGTLESEFLKENKENLEFWKRYAGDTFWGSYIESMQEE